MTIGILGAGATGGLIAARLARAGQDVLCVARGRHLEAMRSRGLRVIGPDGEFSAAPRCTEDLDELRGLETVFVTLKAHSLPALASQLAMVLRDTGTVITAQNGIPWWYFQHHGGEYEGRHLESVDPGGALARGIDPSVLVGCVVYPATRIAEPGVIQHAEGNRLSLGEPGGSRSDRSLAVSGVLRAAGFKAPITLRIREEIWLKLLGNATFNPISALTGLGLTEIAGDVGGRELVRAFMEEALAVACAFRVDVPLGIERRIDAAAGVHGHRPSMLQDVEQGRPLEVEALLGAVVEMARIVAVPVPRLESLLGLTRLLDASVRARSAARRGESTETTIQP